MSPALGWLRGARASDGVMIDMASRCLEVTSVGILVGGSGSLPLFPKIKNKIYKYTSLCSVICSFIYIVRLNMIFIYIVLCLVQLTRFFWPNTCLVSMCIPGSSGKQA